MANLLFHANSQSVTAGLPITRFLENPALIHDAASLAAFEAHVDPHDNAQLATILMSALPTPYLPLSATSCATLTVTLWFTRDTVSVMNQNQCHINPD